MKALIFTNDFHKTKFISRKHVGAIVSRPYVNRIINRLCGIPDCQCGGLRNSKYDFEQINTSNDACKIIQKW